jgi:hypothetical protein
MYDRKGNIIDRREMLKIKFLSLSAEMKIIKREEERLRRRLQRIRGYAKKHLWPAGESIHLYPHYDSLWSQMRQHRFELLLIYQDTIAAYRILRGTICAEEVAKLRDRPSWDTIERMLKKYGPTEPIQLLALAA